MSHRPSYREAATQANIVRNLHARYFTRSANSSPVTVSADTDYTVEVDASGGAITVNLPALSTCRGQVFVIKKTDATANAVTLDGNGGETIDGSATQSITVQFVSMTVIAPDSGTNWLLIWGYNPFAVALTSTGGAPSVFFGNGQGGAITEAVNRTLAADVYATTYVVNNGVSIFTNGFRIFASTSITNNGTIENNGAASTIVIGTRQNSNFYGRGVNAVSNGGFGAGNNGNNGGPWGGNGGNGGTGDGGANAAGTGGVSTASTAAGGNVPSLPQLLSGRSNDTAALYLSGSSGGNGGGGTILAGGVGGVGGEGGGVVFLSSRAITNNGTVSATGGAGGASEASAAPNGGGGGGGGGGSVVIIASTYTGTAPVVTGGAGGSGRGTGTNGAAGSSGRLYSYVG